jgi:putative FmdB family regulatory protein
MPIYDVMCHSCGTKTELLVMSNNEPVACPDCGSPDTQKLMAPTSSLTGRNTQAFPGPADTACCGSSPSHASCAGPGSCCGKAA